jgi:hypothetical protein
MTLKRLVICSALALAAAFPAAASAQLQIAPPGGDSTGDMINLGSLRLSPSVVGYDADTSGYTTEAGEFDTCGQSHYGKTIWSTFRTPRYGRLDVTAAGYDSVLGLGRITGGRIQGGPCTDRIGGRIESFPRDALPKVKKNATYALQVGGFQQPDGSFAGGPLEIAVELLPPNVVTGDAILTYRFGRGGIKITSLKIDGARGSTITVGCVKRSCGKAVAFSVRKPSVTPLQRVDLARRSSKKASSVFLPAAKPKAGAPTIHSAAKTIFRGRKVKNGDTLLVAVQSPDEIGTVFFWRIRKNQAGTKNLGCLEPNSARIKRVGSCTGA